MSTKIMARKALVTVACVATALTGTLALVHAQEPSPDAGRAAARQPAIVYASPGQPRRELALLAGPNRGAAGLTPRTRPSVSLRGHRALTKPEGVDLDVTFIQMRPLYNTYRPCERALCAGTENDKRWPDHGELVTFTAHFMNKGTVPSGLFAYEWRIDGALVASGSHPGLAPGEEGTATYQWPWAHHTVSERLIGEHTVRFTVDPANTIAETYESNNSIEDRTDATPLGFQMMTYLYQILESPPDPRWPFSAEDWVQRLFASWNAGFARSIHPLTPNGIEERVRLDQFRITDSPVPNEGPIGGWWYHADDNFWDAETDGNAGGLLHELTHQLGIIDLYSYNLGACCPANVKVLDRNARPVETRLQYPWPDMMSGLFGQWPLVYSEHTAMGLNLNKGYRRGYYGEYQFDVPATTSVRVLDSAGRPAAGVTLRFYQPAAGFGIDNVPEIEVMTDGAGLAALPNRPVGEPFTTRTGHAFHDNPFGRIDTVGANIFLVEVSKGSHQEYAWFDLTELNVLFWRGQDTFEIASHVPRDDAPAPPASVSGIQEKGEIEVRWEASPSAGVTSYSVYRTTGPRKAWTRIATGVNGFRFRCLFIEEGPYESTENGFAVTAVDSLGRESGFSEILWGLQVFGQMGVAINPDNQRVVLCGRWAALQAPDGRYLKWLDVPVYNQPGAQVAVDPQGLLVTSSPPDHTVTIADGEGHGVSRTIGGRGTNAGQFRAANRGRCLGWCVGVRRSLPGRRAHAAARPPRR